MSNDFYTLPTRSIGNKNLRLEFLANAGPRIVRLFAFGSEENLLAEVPDLKQATSHGDFFFRGGHRLWHAPESLARTYMPDNKGLMIEDLSDGVRLVQPTEPETGITKSIEIHLDPQKPLITLLHMLQNDSAESVELAPWAITQFKLGGVAILPQQMGPLDKDGLLPNRSLVLWPYTRWQDLRLELRDEYIAIHARSELPPCKVGYLNRDGWLGYRLNQVLFIKRFQPITEAAHPDFNCNAEVYCGNKFIELESLAPLVRLAPGQRTTHKEVWEVHRVTQEGEQSIEKLIDFAKSTSNPHA